MAKTPVAVDTDAADPKYKLDKLREHSEEILGVSMSTFDGATFGLQDGEYTIPEIKHIIAEWQRKEAK